MRKFYFSKFVFILFIAALAFAHSAVGQIALRGAATTGNSTSATLLINKPAGVVVGDVMIVNIVQTSNASTAPSLSGWTSIPGSNFGGGTPNRYGALLYRVVDGTEGASFTFTTPVSGGSIAVAGAIVAFSGVDVSGSPFDVAPGSISTGGTDPLPVPAITTATSNAAVVMFGMNTHNTPGRTYSAWNTTTPGALAEIYDFNGSPSSFAAVGAAWAIKSSAGTTGPTSNIDLSGIPSGANGGILIALKPLLPPTITSLGSTGDCEGNSITINGTNLTGATAANVKIGGTPVSSISSNNGSTIVAVIGAGTTGTVTVTIGGNTATSASTFTVNPLPTIVSVSGGGNVCNTTTLTASNGSSGTIYFQGTTSNGTSTATPSSSQVINTSGTYYFRAQSAAGCWGPQGSAIVTIVTPPNPVTVSGTGTFCGSTTITASGGSGGTIYFQGTTSGGTSTGTPSFSQVVSATGTYYFRSYSATCGWGQEGSVTVTINPLPTATTVSGAGPFCVNTTITAANGGSGTIYFQGTTSGGTSIATPSTSQSISASGTYYFRAQSAAGCWGNEGIAVVTINPLPTALTMGGAGTFCGSTTITANNGGSGIIYFQGTTSGGTSTATPATSQVVSSSGTYYFRARSAAGCWGAEGSVSVTINPLPTATTVSGGGPFCVNTTITAANGGSGTIYFQGTTSGGTSIATPSTSQSISASGTYYFRAQSAAGCWGNEGSAVVTINPLPTALTMGGAGTFCGSTTITANNGGSGIIYFQGTTSGGTSTATPATSQVVSSSGTYYFRARSAAGCWGAEGSVPVTINPIPAAVTVSGAGTYCGSTTITATGGAGGTIYFQGTTSNGTSTATPSSSQVISTLGVGTYYFRSQSSAGCWGTEGSAVVDINPLPAGGTLSATATTFCAGTTVTFTATPGFLLYKFYKNGVVAQNASTQNDWNTSGLINGDVITVEVFNGNCTAFLNSITVAVSPLPVATLAATETSGTTPNDNIICTGATVNFTAGGGNSYSLRVNGTQVNSNTTGVFTLTTLNTNDNVTVEATNANGCKSISPPINFTVNALPAGSITAAENSGTPNDNIICAGANVTFTATGGTSYQFKVNSSIVQAFSAAATYSTTALPNAAVVTVDVTNAAGCTSTFTLSPLITVNSLPSVIITPSPAFICFGGSTSLIASGANTYSWSPATGLSATTGSNVTANPTTTTTYTVTGTSTSGCVSSNTVAVTVNPLPAIAVSPASVSICTGSNTSLSATGPSVLFFNWSPTAGLSSTTNPTVTANPLTSTAYTVTGTDLNGCTNTAIATVTVNPLPTITVSPASPAICNGLSTTLTAGGAATYSWSPATGLSAPTGATVTASPTTTTTYTVTGTDANGCVNSTSFTVTVNPVPTVTVTPTSATICSGLGTSLTASGANTYSWTPAAGLSATTGATVTASPTSTTIYTVTGTNASGCINTATVTITVNPLPTVIVTPASATICNNLSTSLTASGASTYSWSPAAGLSATTGATVTANPSTTTTYTVTGTDANGCINTTTVTITVNPLPTITVTPASATICNGLSTSLTASGASTYSWSPATGLSATTGATVTANPTSTTTYTVTGINANGCINSTTVTITVNPLPTIAVTPTSATICNSLGTSLTASGGATYSWSPATGLSATTGATVTASPSTTTTYTVTGMDANGCINTASATITVNPLPAITVTPASATICNGVSTSLTASGVTSYSWSPATGLSATTGATVTANPTTTTTYTVTGTDANGCINTATATITVNPLPTVMVTPASATICNGLSTLLTASGASTYSWSPATGLSATTGATVTANPTTTTIYTVTGTDVNGCINSTTVTITVNPLPTITVSPASPAICNGLSTTLTASGASTYSWSPAAGLSATTGATVTANPSTTTTYTVTGTDVNGCINSVNVTVTVNPVPVPTLTGKNPICINDKEIYTTQPGQTNYVWTVTPGAGTITPGTGGLNDNTIEVTWTSAGTKNINVNYTNSYGCTAALSSTFTNAPTTPPPTFATGIATACLNSTGNAYSTQTGKIDYAWTVTGGSITSGGGINDDFVTVTWNTVGAKSVSVNYSDIGSCNAANPTIYPVTVNPLTGPTSFIAGATTVCQNAADETYTATAANSTVITYSVAPAAAGVINASTGVMDWNAAFSGTATITATSTGLCGTTTADRIVTVNPSTGITSFTAGATTVCQNAANETYTATAPNSTSISYSVSPAGAGVITATTGVMDWNAAFSGTATITATSTGLCGTTTSDRIVTVNPSTDVPVFTAGATTVCQNAADETYTATAANSTSTTYSVLPAGAGVINATSGLMDWNAAFSGTATITATSTGLCGTTTADRIVTVNPSTGITSFTAGATTVCQNAADETYTATAANSTSITYSVSPAGAGVINASSGLMDWNAAFSGTATITATSTGSCGTTTADRIVTVNPSTFVPVFTVGATTVCQNAADETYTATSANSTSVSYSVLPTGAGVVNASTGVMDWNVAFSGNATITATATGSCGTNTADRIVTVNPSTGATSFTAGATTVCQNAANETYTATAPNSTSISYSVSPAGAGVINSTTGVMDWNAVFSGTATITATSAGLCGTTTADRIVTVNQSTGPTSFTAGATTICQNAADETYTATATNSSSITYSVAPPAAGVINSSTGVMDWNVAFSGPATITATSTGLCGTTTANRPVTVNGTTGTTSFTAGATTVCQNAANETYTATAPNSTSITYSVLPAGAGVINASTGVMDWAAAFSGSATITANANGLCGTSTANRVVTVNPSPGTPSFTTGAITVCQNAADETYTATAANSTSISYTVSPAGAGAINASTGVMDWNAAFTGTATVTATATGLCGTTSTNRAVTVNAPPAAPFLTPATATMCQGSILGLTAGTTPITTTATATYTGPNITITDNNTTGIANPLVISGIPAGAVINSVNILFNITHGNDADLRINLKGPNGVILNLVDREGTTNNNFTNTNITSISPAPNGNIIGKAAPFTGTYAPEAAIGVSGGTALGGNSTATSFANLIGTPNGNWVIGVRDGTSGNTGTLNNWTITINYSVTSTPQAVTWTPITDLYTDAAATVAYTGTALSTVYTKPSTSGTKTYTATVTNAANCTSSSNVVLTVNPIPVVSVAADYCVVPGKVRLTASTSPTGATYVWSTGQTTSFIDIDIADIYDVVATYPTGCSATGSISVANELVTNGDFTNGNTGFISDYNFKPDIGGPVLVPAGQGELFDDSGNNGYSVTTDAQNVHALFWGLDHTANTVGSRNYMIVNGHGTIRIWEQTVNVLPSTTYYFSGWGMSVNNYGPFAKLQFSVNGTQVGSIANLAAGVNSNSNNGWTRFYGTWTSGPTTTTAVINIVNNETALSGNDFGLDDISFATLSAFITLVSAPGTDAQTACVNTPITPVVYYVGSGNAPLVTGLPAGVTSSFNGVNLIISGTPTVAGNSAYSISTTGTCNPITVTGTINVQSATISLTSGTSTQTVCKGAPIANIVYTIGGTATGASITAGTLPTGVTGTFAGNLFTISGTPTQNGTFNYTITTTGTCTPATITGTITVQDQTITYTSGGTAQTVCINTAITNIVHTVGLPGGSGSVTGLPAGVTGALNSGLFVISGTPTQAGTFNYTITISGTCNNATASGSITVEQQTLTLTTGNSLQPYCMGGAIINIVYNVGGTATNATVSGLPTGVTAVYSAGVLTISGTPTQAGTFGYTVTTSGSCATLTATGTLTSGGSTWTGTVSTDWSNPGNWGCGSVPVPVSDVVIPTGSIRMPQLTATSVCRSLVLQPSTVLDLNGQNFTSFGGITGTGLVKGSPTSNLTIIAASSASSIYFDQATDGVTNSLNNLFIGGAGSSVTINNKSAVYGTLTPASGNLTLKDTLVLRSTATGTASVAAVTGAIGYTATGKVTVERYFPAIRSWRLITSPLSNTGTILDTWQIGGGPAAYIAGKGMFVTAPAAVAGNGIDPSFFNNYSMYTYAPGTTYIGVTHTDVLLSNSNPPPLTPANIGYFTFVRGDRNRTQDNTIFPNVNTTTLSSTGNLQTGDMTFNFTGATGDFALIGNPYASAVDFDKIITSANVVPKRFYVYDPRQGSTGIFVTIEKQSNGSYLATPSSSLDQYIQSGQAFFVELIGGAGSVTFHETDKTSNYAISPFRPIGAIGSIRTTLLQTNGNSSPLLVDGNLVLFDASFNNVVDAQDAPKFTNITENLGLQRNNKTLSVERRQLITDKDTIFLQLTQTTKRSYRFEFEPTNLDPLLTAFLEDSYTGKSNPLNLQARTAYDFDITGDAKTAATNRFRIVFKQSTVVPVTYKAIKAYQKAANIMVDWTVENEINIKTYDVEKSVDGVKFKKVNTTTAIGANRTTTDYSWLDTNPLTGNNFYRIRSNAADGKFEYSPIVLVKIGQAISGIRIYPNPVSDGIIGAEFKNMESGIYHTRLLNTQGQTILSKTINHAGGTSMEYIRPDYKLISGIYELEITAPDKKISKVKVIVK